MTIYAFSQNQSKYDLSENLNIAEYRPIFTNKNNMFDNAQFFWPITAAGGSSTYIYNESVVEHTLAAGSAAGLTQGRQTSRYFPYEPGMTLELVGTGLFTPAANAFPYLRFGDSENGISFGSYNQIPAIVILSKVSGVVVPTIRYQTEWNGNKLINVLDMTKRQSVKIEFQWDGNGPIKVYLKIQGKYVLIHTEIYDNSMIVPFMRTGSLPIRFGIESIGVIGGSPVSMKEGSFSLGYRGEYAQIDYEYADDMKLATVAGVTARKLIYALRLKNLYNSNPNRTTLRVRSWRADTTTNDAFFELVHCHGVVVGTGNFSNTLSGAIDPAESAYDGKGGVALSLTITEEHIIDTVKATTASGNKSQSFPQITDTIHNHGIISQNLDSTGSQYLCVFATGTAPGATVGCGISYDTFN